MAKYFDAHTHVQFAAFDEDRREVIKRAMKAGVSFINVGTQADTSAAAVKLANEYSTFSNSRELENKDLAKEIKVAGANVYASVGLHPIHTERSYHDEQELGTQINADDTQINADKFPRQSASSQRKSALGFTSREEEFDYDYYKKLALDPKVVAIGECGLDYYRLSEETKEKQKSIFIKQIELAHDVKKPLMIHCREAFGDLIELLTTNYQLLNSTPGVVHFYSGTVEDTKKLMDLGFSFTFGGVVTFTRDYDEIIKMIPLDRILSETDAPYVAPMPYRGKRNEPAYVIETVKKLAEIKGVSMEQMQQQIWENAKTIFTI